MEHANRNLIKAVGMGLLTEQRKTEEITQSGSLWSLCIDPEDAKPDERTDTTYTNTQRKEKTMNKRSEKANLIKAITACTVTVMLGLSAAVPAPALAAVEANQQSSAGQVAKVSSDTGATTGQVTAEDNLIDKISRLLDANRVEEALELANEAVARDQSNPVAFYVRSMVRYFNQQPVTAVLLDLDRAIELDGNFLEALAARAVVHEQMFEYELAVNDLDRVLELQPDAFDMLELRMTLHEQLNDFAGLVADCSLILAQYPEDAQVLYWRALYRTQLNDMEGALADLRLAEEILIAEGDNEGLSIIREQIASIEDTSPLG